MTTDDDYIEIELVKGEEEENEIKKIKFMDYFPTEDYNLKSYLNTACKDYIEWRYLSLYRSFTMRPLQNMIIRKMSHRVELMTGFYNTKLPLQYRKDTTYDVDCIPILNHTKFYLVSLQGNPMYANIGEQQYTPSIIGNIDTWTVDGKPLIYNFEKEGKPLKIKTYTDSLKNLEISLVDFQFQPVVLKSPLNLCIKIKPAKDADIDDILTK